MLNYEKDGCLVVELDSRMDAANSDSAEAEIREAVRQHPGLPLCLDADRLEYISSSGLRVLLKFQKASGGLKIINVSPEVYEIFETTGFNSFLTIQKRRRRVNVDGCRILGQGAFGTVYRLDEDTVVKVYHGDSQKMLPIIETERERARQAFLAGVPTAIPFDIVRVGDEYGAVFEMIDAENCNDLIVKDPAETDRLIPKYAELIKTLHSLHGVSGQLSDIRELYLEQIDEFACLDSETADRLKELLRGIPDADGIIHGDIQLKNVMISGDEMILIDMDHMHRGNPVFEFAGLFATYVAFNEDEPENTLKFVGIGREDAARIFNSTLEAYLGCSGGPDMEETRRKVQTAGYLRFLQILMIEMKDLQSELKDTRIRHAAEHLKELSGAISSLGI